MGPTNLALVKLYQTDQEYRDAQARLEAATRDVRIQQRKVNDLLERLKLAQVKLKESQVYSATLELDIKSRDAHIEKLRTQQQNAKNQKEYQTFLVEINTEKVDRNKVEDQTFKALETTEQLATEVKELSEQLGADQARLKEMQGQIGQTVARLQAEVQAIMPKRQEAAAAVPAKPRDVFERLAERFDGEALASIGRPDARHEEYVCNACNMSLVADVYNRLHVRDELVFCPSCRRILYIPDDLTLDLAVNAPKNKKQAAEAAP